MENVNQRGCSLIEERISKIDGTIIGMKVIGSGPGLVLVQGAMGTAASWSNFAQALSKWFTVIVPDRRGRGLSPMADKAKCGLAAEADDLKVILERFKASYVFSLSSGAVITLFAAAKGLPVEKIIAYEPPFFTNGHFPQKYLDSYYQDLKQGNLVSAFYNAGCAVNPKLRLFPKWLFEKIFPGKPKKTAGGYIYDPEFKELVESLAFDFAAVSEAATDMGFLRDIAVPIGLFGGAESPKFLKADLDSLSALIPGSERITIDKAGHSTMWDYDAKRNPHSDPARIALAVKDYFLGKQL